MTNLLINILAFGTLLSSVFSITSKNPVISVIFLISTFVQAALYLILIGINFVGISYIVIYVGAIAVLFLFVIMMINIKLTDILETGSQYTKNLPLAIAIGSLFIYIIFSPSLSEGAGAGANPTFGFGLWEANDIAFQGEISILNPLYSCSDAAEGQYTIIGEELTNLCGADTLITEFQQIEVLGHGLYTYGASLLITLSIILLLAMFATIVISSTNENNSHYNK